MQSKFCIYSVYPMGSVWKMNRATERSEMIHKNEKENEDKRKEKL